MQQAHRPEEPANAFHDFIEHELRTDDLDVPDIFALVPRSVVDAAWQRFLQRLNTQTQALADDPQVDIWEELLSDEHRAIVAAVERTFLDFAQPNGISQPEWQHLLHCAAVVTLHIEENGSQVLEPADFFPYLQQLADDEEDDDEAAEPASIRTLSRRAVRALPVARTSRHRARINWLDVALGFTVSGLFWIGVTELIARAGW